MCSNPMKWRTSTTQLAPGFILLSLLGEQDLGPEGELGVIADLILLAEVHLVCFLTVIIDNKDVRTIADVCN